MKQKAKMIPAAAEIHGSPTVLQVQLVGVWLSVGGLWSYFGIIIGKQIE